MLSTDPQYPETPIHIVVLKGARVVLRQKRPSYWASRCEPSGCNPCQIVSCDGERLRLSIAALWLLVLSLDKSECDRVSERDRLGLTPDLTTKWARGSENFVYLSLWDFKSFLHVVKS
jgi:hypothetical protein